MFAVGSYPLREKRAGSSKKVSMLRWADFKYFKHASKLRGKFDSLPTQNPFMNIYM